MVVLQRGRQSFLSTWLKHLAFQLSGLHRNMYLFICSIFKDIPSSVVKLGPVPDNTHVVMHNHPRYILDHCHSIVHLKEMPPAPLYKNKNKTWRNNSTIDLTERNCYLRPISTFDLNVECSRCTFLLMPCSVDYMYLQTEHIWVDIISIHVLLRLTRPEGEPSRAES